MVLTCITNWVVLNVMLSPEQHKTTYICTCNYLNIPALVFDYNIVDRYNHNVCTRHILYKYNLNTRYFVNGPHGLWLIWRRWYNIWRRWYNSSYYIIQKPLNNVVLPSIYIVIPLNTVSNTLHRVIRQLSICRWLLIRGA